MSDEGIPAMLSTRFMAVDAIGVLSIFIALTEGLASRAKAANSFQVGLTHARGERATISYFDNFR